MPDIELEHACVEITRDADFIACARPDQLAPHKAMLEEARERLNDALAKAERALEAA